MRLAVAIATLFLGVAVQAQPFTVAITASDDPALAAPAARADTLTVSQVEQMVRRAVHMAGGLGEVIADTARLVVIKPNVVTPQASGSGVVADTRIVRAVALLVHEVAPHARILIAEGAGGWISPAKQDCVDVGGWLVEDGFEAAGHRATAAELRQLGIDVECFDLNFDRVLTLVPPTGGLSMEEYDLAASIIEADAWINVPVAKTHGTKITCCLKNQFGLFPGIVYGWNKTRGTEGHRGIPHAPRVIDETFIDLLSLTEPDFHVVDMIAGAEGGASSGKPKRSNLIVAGRDAISTDLVVAQLMGFNPDDFEYAPLGYQHDIGPGSIDHVTVRGGSVIDLADRFKKASMDYTSEWAEHAGFGMGPRRWTLLGPLDRDHAFGEADLRALSPTPGKDGWTEITRFGDDRIDLDKFYDDPTHCAVYAFTRFTMATSDSVRVWVSSDEDLQVWIDGESVHQFEGRRRHVLGGTREHAYIEAGEHTLVVRAGQRRGRFDFSINICEPIDDPLYAGNRYPGVRYFVTQRGETTTASRQIAAEHIREDGRGEAYFESTLTEFDPVSASRVAADSILLADRPFPATTAMAHVAMAIAGQPSDMIDSATAQFMGVLPVQFGYMESGGWFDRELVPPGRLLSWLGLDYDVRAGLRSRESRKIIHGWLSEGRIPILGYGDAWFAATGIRHRDDAVDLHWVTHEEGADTTYWQELRGNWWGQFSGDNWQNCPVIVVERRGPPPTFESLTDSITHLIVEMGTKPQLQGRGKPWGEDPFPGGLNAWDEWIVQWERHPLTRQWLEEDEQMRRQLTNLSQDWSLGYIVWSRRRISDYCASAAQRLASDRRASYLQEAARSYDVVTKSMQQVLDALPERSSGDWTEEDLLRIEKLPETLTYWKQARTAERDALSSLSQMLGAGGLPTIRLDPLRNLDRGTRLATWRAETSRGVFDLTLQGDQLSLELVFGRQPEGPTSQIAAAFEQQEGYAVALEVVAGPGRYQILEQPDAANDWTTRIRIDDHNSWQSGTELNIWAVPVD
ncbi:MAG: DUF362 domain-containing protein [Gemmatimonadetes bacterium]|nr:DUF362 domain-containing protein [Gemmatimonadota bacterium]